MLPSGAVVRSRLSRTLTRILLLSVVAAGGLCVARAWAIRRGANEVVRGQKIAQQQGCFGCHGGATGAEAANPGSRYGTIPRLNGGDSRLYAQSPREVAEWISDGAPGSLRTDAEAWRAYGLQQIRMPAFSQRLSAREISDLTAYVLAANAWFAPEVEPAARGEEVVRRHCLGCHNVGGAGGLENPGGLLPIIPGFWGADFEDLVRSDAELREWILDGKSRRLASRWPVRWFWSRQLISMPAFRDRLADEDVDSVIAYIRWLGRTRGGTAEEGPA